MIVANSKADTVQHVRSKAHTAEAFHRRLLAGSVLLLRPIQVSYGSWVEESVSVIAVDSFNKICNRRGEALSGVGFHFCKGTGMPMRRKLPPLKKRDRGGF